MATGTKKLDVAHAYAGGLVIVDAKDSDTDFIRLGKKVLFKGFDEDGLTGLWVTDGTARGTTELAVKGAWSGGVLNGSDPDFTHFGDRVLFNGGDASGLPGLWVTDGTAVGTKEIGVAGAWSHGLDPSAITAFPPPPKTPSPSGLVLAAASDSGVKGDGITTVARPTITGKGEAGDKVTLQDGAKVVGTAVVGKGGAWSVTPATALAVGVHTLTATETGETGTSVASEAFKLTIESAASPAHFTGRALFAGYAPGRTGLDGRIDLWVTDGTVAGTIDLMAPRAYSPLGFDFITVTGPRAMFLGTDTNSPVNPWITDGTPAGTRELTAAGAYSGGLLAYYPGRTFASTGPHFTALGTKVVV